MTKEERIKANTDKGYTLVAEFDGWEIWKKLNEVSGWTYYSDQIGYEGFFPMWDTAINSQAQLMALVSDLGDEPWIDLKHELPPANVKVQWYDATFDNVTIFSLENPAHHDSDFTHWMHIPKRPKKYDKNNTPL